MSYCCSSSCIPNEFEMKTSGFFKGPPGPTGPGGTGSGVLGNYVGTGYFGPGFTGAGTTTPDTMSVDDAINLLRQPNTYYPTKFGYGIGSDVDTSDPTSVIIGDHSENLIFNSSPNSVNIGNFSGQQDQGYGSVAIGFQAGFSQQGASSVSLGGFAGCISQGSCSVAIGMQAGFSSQGNLVVALGAYAGYSNQNSAATAIGVAAGGVNQGVSSVAIGNNAGEYNQGISSVAIGYYAGYTTQGQNAVAIGYYSGSDGQNPESVAIGSRAGRLAGTGSISIGYNANAGTTGSLNSIAIGPYAGEIRQGDDNISIGAYAGVNNFRPYTIAIGSNAGNFNQGTGAIAIGRNSNYYSAGQHSVAIGTNAGYTTGISDNSIYINASGLSGSVLSQNSCIITPIRNVLGPNNMFYDPVTNEITWGTLAPSSIKYKENVTSITSEYKSILNLEPVSFNYKKDNRMAMGFIAEDVNEFLPETILYHKLSNEIETVDYSQIAALLLKLLQKQHSVIKMNNTILKSLINV